MMMMMRMMMITMMMTIQDERKRSQGLQMHWEGAEEGDSDRSDDHLRLDDTDFDHDLDDYDDDYNISLSWSRGRQHTKVGV